MPLELTPEVQEALDHSEDESARLVDPRTNAEYVLLTAERYERLREIEEDDRVQHAIRMTALRNAVRRAEEAP